MSTSRDPDRPILFTDAVVAIAITLLILPLVELAAVVPGLAYTWLLLLLLAPAINLVVQRRTAAS